MLARLAENMFWMGRYVERAEDTALMLDVTYHGLLESAPPEASEAWRNLLDVLRVLPAYGDRPLTDAEVTSFLVLEEANPGSIVSSVAHMRHNARSVRELVSTELWQVVNNFYLDLRARDLLADLHRQPHDLYGMVKLRCQTFYGVASETMPRDDGWRFIALGRMLERAEMTCRLLNVRYRQLAADPHAGFHDWVLVLKSASAFEAYRKSHRAAMDSAHVVEFLLFRENFPRSVLFCLRSAEMHLARLAPPHKVTRAQRLLGRIRAELEFRELEDLLEEGLHTFLDRVQQQVWAVADAVADQFFRHELRGDLQLHTVRPVAGPGG